MNETKGNLSDRHGGTFLWSIREIGRCVEILNAFKLRWVSTLRAPCPQHAGGIAHAQNTTIIGVLCDRLIEYRVVGIQVIGSWETGASEDLLNIDLEPGVGVSRTGYGGI